MRCLRHSKGTNVGVAREQGARGVKMRPDGTNVEGNGTEWSERALRTQWAWA